MCTLLRQGGKDNMSLSLSQKIIRWNILSLPELFKLYKKFMDEKELSKASIVLRIMENFDAHDFFSDWYEIYQEAFTDNWASAVCVLAHERVQFVHESEVLPVYAKKPQS